MTKKTMTAVLAANNGLHSARALSTVHNIMHNHDLSQPILYHMVLTGSESIAAYQATIKALVRRLRNYGCRTEYFGAFENQPMKGLHAHCFLLIETGKKTPFKVLDIKDGSKLQKLAAEKGLNPIHLAKPKNPMHDDQLFARPVGGKLADCLSWVTYIFKNRSKHSVESRETYFNSEFKANTVKRAAELAALVAPKAKLVQEAAAEAQEAPQEASVVQASPQADPVAPAVHEQPTTPTNEGDNQVTPAEFQYLAGVYEDLVSQDLDLHQIQNAVAKQGIRRRTQYQTIFELEHVFGFPGYAATHGARAGISVAEFDAAIDSGTDKSDRLDKVRWRSPVNAEPSLLLHASAGRSAVTP